MLEIGTYIGFSTLAWAEAVGPTGHVTTLEYEPEYATIAKANFDRQGLKNTEIIVGDAGESNEYTHAKELIEPCTEYLSRKASYHTNVAKDNSDATAVLVG